MDEKEREVLMTSLHRSSVTGTGIITFTLAFLVLHYTGMDILPSAMISALIAAAIALARIRSGL